MIDKADFLGSTDIRTYLAPDLDGMVDEIVVNGIIYEGQFDKYHSMAHKQIVPQIVDILEEETSLKNILYAYDKKYMMGLIYDGDRYSYDEAIKLSYKYQGP